MFNLEELRAKAADELSEDERAFIEEHKDELTDEEKAKFFPSQEEEGEKGAEGDDAEGADDNTQEDNKEGDDEEKSGDESDDEGAEDGDGSGDDNEEEGDSEDEGEGEGDESDDSDDDAGEGDGDEGEGAADEEDGERKEAKRGKMVKITASKLNELQTAAKRLAEIEPEYKTLKVEAHETAVKSEIDGIGGLAPAAKESAFKYAKNIASREERDAFYKVLASANPGVTIKKRKSSSEKAGLTKEQQKHEAAKRLAKEKGIGIADAVRELSRQED